MHASLVVDGISIIKAAVAMASWSHVDDETSPVATSPSDAAERKDRKDRYVDSEQSEARHAALERELHSVRAVNEVLEGVVSSLERSKGNMESVSKTVDNAYVLLNRWTRILSQTEHNQRLILNPDWKGATQDLADIESQVIEKEKAAQRQAAEEERRRAEAQRKREEEEEEGRQCLAGSAPRGVHGHRGRGRSMSRITRGGHISTASSSLALSRSNSARGTSSTGRHSYLRAGTRGKPPAQ